MAGINIKKLSLDKSKRIRETLQELDCPYLEGLDEITTHELLFSQGEARLRLLEWLLGKYNPQLLLRHSSLSQKGPNTHIAKLTLLFSELYLCTPNDYELIKGTTDSVRQLQFLETLTNMVLLSCGYDSELLSRQFGIFHDMEQSCFFLDALCRQGDISCVIPTSISLLPPDVSPLCGLDKNALSTKESSLPSLAQLRDQSNNLKKQLIERQHQLEEIMANVCDDRTDMHVYTPIDNTAIFSCCQSLQVSLTTLGQLMDDFLHLYQTEIRPWTGQDVPKLGPLGPCAKRLHTHLQVIDELLESAKKLDKVCSSLNNLQQLTVTRSEFYDRAHSHFQSQLTFLQQ